MSGVVQRYVGTAEEGARLDRWFKRHYPRLPHGQLEKLLRTGQIRVDGGRAKAGDRLAAGQTIRVPPLDHLLAETAASRPRERMALSREDTEGLRKRLIYKDEDVLVLDKPYGLAVQGGPGIQRHLDGMLDALTFEAGERPRLVHRLDRDTTGVMVLARNAPAAAALARAFQARDSRKIYWALSAGVPVPRQGTIDLPLVKHGGERGERGERVEPATRGDPGAKTAVTHYAVVEHAATKAAWVALMPVTGRTHQLRAHLAAIGTPIAGDSKYGGERAVLGGEVAPGLHLHAREIAIAHPRGHVLHAVAPLPPHMARSWALFGFPAAPDSDPFAALEG